MSSPDSSVLTVTSLPSCSISSVSRFVVSAVTSSCCSHASAKMFTPIVFSPASIFSGLIENFSFNSLPSSNLSFSICFLPLEKSSFSCSPSTEKSSSNISVSTEKSSFTCFVSIEMSSTFFGAAKEKSFTRSLVSTEASACSVTIQTSCSDRSTLCSATPATGFVSTDKLLTTSSSSSFLSNENSSSSSRLVSTEIFSLGCISSTQKSPPSSRLSAERSSGCFASCEVPCSTRIASFISYKTVFTWSDWTRCSTETIGCLFFFCFFFFFFLTTNISRISDLSAAFIVVDSASSD